MSPHLGETSTLQLPLADLEQAFIAEFLRSRGYDAAALAALPEPVRIPLMKDALLYASGRLAEVESRSRMLHEIAEDDPPT